MVPETKPQANVVSAAMRERLLKNRDGRLHKGQWSSVITEPITILLMLAAPAILIIGPRFKYLFALNLWLLLLLIVAVIGVPAYRRARRYRAAPMKFAVLRSPVVLHSRLMIWKEDEFLDDQGQLVRFRQRLAPSMRLMPDRAYLVYYLVDRGKNVLLSLAPADHPQARDWYPTRNFARR